MVTAEILPFRENSHGRAGNRTRDLTISRQRLWSLDHEAGLVTDIVNNNIDCLFVLYIFFFFMSCLLKEGEENTKGN